MAIPDAQRVKMEHASEEGHKTIKALEETISDLRESRVDVLKQEEEVKKAKDAVDQLDKLLALDARRRV